MRILALGDIIAPVAVDFLAENLWEYRRREKIDFVVANGENASFLGGIAADAAKKLLLGGVDVITGGNHSLQNKGVYALHEEEERVLRPINYPTDVPGRGYTLAEAVTLEDVQARGEALLRPVESMFTAYPLYTLPSPGKEARVRNGNPITVPELADGTYRVHGKNGEFLCLSCAENGTLTSIKNFFGA